MDQLTVVHMVHMAPMVQNHLLHQHQVMVINIAKKTNKFNEYSHISLEKNIYGIELLSVPSHFLVFLDFHNSSNHFECLFLKKTFSTNYKTVLGNKLKIFKIFHYKIYVILIYLFLYILYLKCNSVVSMSKSQ